jgi:hypothetical protein
MPLRADDAQLISLHGGSDLLAEEEFGGQLRAEG